MKIDKNFFEVNNVIVRISLISLEYILYIFRIYSDIYCISMIEQYIPEYILNIFLIDTLLYFYFLIQIFSISIYRLFLYTKIISQYNILFIFCFSTVTKKKWNSCIIKILLTIYVIGASAHRMFSNLKLIKTSLRWIM